MKIPFFDLKRQYDVWKDELESAVTDVLGSTQYINGPATKQFEEAFAAYIGSRYAVSCGNGTDALRIALQACGVGRGDEVITTPFSFFATAEAIAEIGAVPVFADIDEQTLNLSPESVRDKLTDRTRAILPVHIFGNPAEMDALLAIAETKGIPVIEDACQAAGASYHGRKAGSIGTVGCFSFYPTKNLGGCGDGGMLTTDDEEIAIRCRAIKAHASGRDGARAWTLMTGESVDELEQLAQGDGLYDPCKYYNYFVGINSRLDSIQAAVLSVKLPHLDELNSRRTGNAEQYIRAFDDLPIRTQCVTMDAKSCWHQFVILSEERDALTHHLNAHGIGTGAFYPIPLHLQRAFRQLGYHEGDLPVAESVCRRSVCLPVFPELTGEEVAYVIDSVREFYR